MYLSYLEYKSMGGTLDEPTFNDLEFQSECEVDWFTFGRFKADMTYPEALKRCMYTLIKLIQEQQQAYIVSPTDANGNVQASVSSQSNDGVSTTFNTLSAQSAAELIKAKIQDTIQKYLTNVTNSLGRKVLYRGIYPGE